jgi:hypothetical protein
MHSFDYFLAGTMRNAWVRESGIELYVRRSIRIGVGIDLAALNADEPGQGSFTRFRDKYEPEHVFCVELIHSPRLPAYLAKRGYMQLGGAEGEISMVSKNYWK